jgi:hypothetical protein
MFKGKNVAIKIVRPFSGVELTEAAIRRVRCFLPSALMMN